MPKMNFISHIFRQLRVDKQVWVTLPPPQSPEILKSPVWVGLSPYYFILLSLTSQIRTEEELSKNQIKLKICFVSDAIYSRICTGNHCPKGNDSLEECSGRKYFVTYYCRNVSHFPARSPSPASLTSIRTNDF